MDYYNLRNLQADTAMRSEISRMAGSSDDAAGAGNLPGSGV